MSLKRKRGEGMKLTREFCRDCTNKCKGKFDKCPYSADNDSYRLWKTEYKYDRSEDIQRIFDYSNQRYYHANSKRYIKN